MGVRIVFKVAKTPKYKYFKKTKKLANLASIFVVVCLLTAESLLLRGDFSAAFKKSQRAQKPTRVDSVAKALKNEYKASDLLVWLRYCFTNFFI